VSEKRYLLQRRIVLRGQQQVLIAVQLFTTKELAEERRAADKDRYESALKQARIAIPSATGRAQDVCGLAEFMMDFGMIGWDQHIIEVEVKSSNIEVVPALVITKH